MREVFHYAEALAVLRDPAYTVPPVPDAGSLGVAWLRAHVARFSGGAVHERRRGHVLHELARVDPAALRREAFDRARARSAPIEVLSRLVPVEVLAAALGAPADIVPLVLAVARVYLPGNGDDPAADAAVGRLVAVFGADERGAARIGLLVQACEATAGLITRAVSRSDTVLLDTLRFDPPVRGTRRIDPHDGAEVFIDFVRANRGGTGEPLTFGAGAHRCPGQEHAMAIAAGVVEAVLRRPAPPRSPGG
jgi:cytochrome P450